MIQRIAVLMAASVMLLAVVSGCGSEQEDKETVRLKHNGKSETTAEQKQASDQALAGEASSESPEKTETPAARSANTPPRVRSAKILPTLVYTDTDAKVEVEAEDPDGDWVNYAYQWMKINAGEAVENAQELEGETEASLSHENFGRDDAIAVRITPSDWYSKGETYQSKYVVISNSAPSILSKPPAAASETYTYQVEAKDVDDDAIRFALAPEAPSGMTIDADTGLLTWTMKASDAGTYQVVVQAHDGHGGSAFQRFSLTVGVTSESEDTASHEKDTAEESESESEE
ncbi:MAG TPA: Ig domain-containing protein [Thermodesulfobacteriota bacterium]|nr:putative Ig domain-containing protein [Deltaproteobacteria bacterium]HNR12341.1 Ig domain-containing protein [Thermodesulfobacteriota bacterium]HNU71683.1 Ig domain-containing protein [Thermodesulfobacteriota bacterium]HQO78144.1 Ig domain-containing protein [Thermodesulfobacteriota bacterium]